MLLTCGVVMIWNTTNTIPWQSEHRMVVLGSRVGVSIGGCRVGGGTSGGDWVKWWSGGGEFPLEDSGSEVMRCSRHLSRCIANGVVIWWGVDSGVGTERVVGEIWQGWSIDPGKNDVDLSNGSRPAMVAH